MNTKFKVVCQNCQKRQKGPSKTKSVFLMASKGWLP